MPLTINPITGKFDVVKDCSAITDHNSLTGLQGGATNSYYHLNSSLNGIVVGNGAGTFTATANNSVAWDLASCISTFRVHLANTQSIPDATWTKIQFDSVDFDLLDEYDEDSKFSFVALNDGYYSFSARAAFVEISTENYSSVYIGIRFILNGDVYSYGNLKPVGTGKAKFPVETHCVQHTTDRVYLARNDEFYVEVYQNSGANTNLITKPMNTYFSCEQYKRTNN